MAHYAYIGSDNIVKTVIVISDDCDADEATGIAWCENFAASADLGVTKDAGDYWKKTSYNSSIRKNYAGRGFTYDAARDAFIAPQSSPGSILDDATCRWISGN